MTTIALNYSQSLLNGFWRVFKNILRGVMIGWIMARQTQANYHIARAMIHEYRNHTVESLHHELNITSLARIRREFGYE